MIQRIEQYDDVLKVILKPTKSFPEGSNYFYTDASARELVESYGWYLSNTGVSTYIRASLNGRKTTFHQAYAYCLGLDAPIIDHINLVGTDNRDVNLNIVTMKENARNKQSKGYYIDSKAFRVILSRNRSLYCCGNYINEFEAIKGAFCARQQHYGDYDYNFLLDRSNDLDILDDELTGKITAEEATFRHVMRYAKDNAWYVYRYGLEDYFNSRGIQIPAFELDSQGYMIDVNTKERLCPFK